jgi:hypothetical protein
MPVWISFTSLSFCAQTVGKPLTAVAVAIAAPAFNIDRRETELVVARKFLSADFVVFIILSVTLLIADRGNPLRDCVFRSS